MAPSLDDTAKNPAVSTRVSTVRIFTFLRTVATAPLPSLLAGQKKVYRSSVTRFPHHSVQIAGEKIQAVQPSEWVATEFGKVRRHYDQLGLGDRAVLEFFDGPHTIHGKHAFEFRRRHLKPPQQP